MCFVFTAVTLIDAFDVLCYCVQPAAANVKRYLELRVAKTLPVLIRNFEVMTLFTVHSAACLFTGRWIVYYCDSNDTIMRK